MEIKDFVKASNAVYLDDEHTMPSGWKLLLPYRQTETGYLGAAYQLPSGEILIAHAGSQFDKYQPLDIWRDWLGANRKLALLDKAPNQFKDAEDFVQDVIKASTNAKIYQTGHSLGGVLAQMSAYKNGHQATVFESPGVKEILKNERISPPNDYDVTNAIHIYNIRESKLSDVNTHITEVRYLEAGLPRDNNGITDIAAMHGLKNFDDAFDDEGNVFKTLQNPAYVDVLLRNKWERNVPNILYTKSDELRSITSPKSQYGSFEDFRNDYIQQNQDVFHGPPKLKRAIEVNAVPLSGSNNRFGNVLNEIKTLIQILEKNVGV